MCWDRALSLAAKPVAMADIVLLPPVDPTNRVVVVVPTILRICRMISLTHPPAGRFPQGLRCLDWRE